MKKLKILDEIERLEEEQDTNEALKALKEIETGKDELIPWKKVKKEFGR